MFSSMLSLLGSLRRGNFVKNSLRFRSSNNAVLSRTPGAAGNRKVWTWSGWVKRGQIGTRQDFFSAAASGTVSDTLLFDASDRLYFNVYSSGLVWEVITTQVFRDPSAWYHIILAVNTDDATDSDRVKLYVNGSRITSFSTAIYPSPSYASGTINNNVSHKIGTNAANAIYNFDGYLTEVNFIDGQALTPSSFGQIESTTGVWSPKQYVGTYGTNGFYLKFADPSAATAAAIGKDSSGNGNNWTPSGISVTAGTTYDSMFDVPVNYSDPGNGRGNYAVLNCLRAPGSQVRTFSNGNLQLTGSIAGNNSTEFATLELTTGKWYFEGTVGAIGTASITSIGVNSIAYQGNGAFLPSGSGAAYTTNDVIGVAFDVDAGTVQFYKNGISQGTVTGTPGVAMTPAFALGGAATAPIWIANFGQRLFSGTPPSGFRTLNTNNLPTPAIVNGANFMAATTYTGNGAARSIVNAVNGISFQPDLVWIKSRTPSTTSHALFDSVRGTTKYLSSDTTAAETTLAQSLTAFNADGFSLGTDTTLVNASANSYIAWQWKESVTAGLDVVSYTGTGVNRTVAHNLGVAPAMVIVKRFQTGATANWQVRHASIAAANSIQLNSTNGAATDTTVWASTAPTSSVFTVGTSTDVNASGISYVAYCFAEIAGFSRFGSYTGNSSTDGPFVLCGFRPRWILLKNTSQSGAGVDWTIWDTSRNEYNVGAAGELFANLPNVEAPPGQAIDVLSNGFKIRSTGSRINVSSNIYIFAAFAELPTKYALAR